MSLSDVIANRLETLGQLNNDPVAQAYAVAASAADIVFWVNEFCWTFDPRGQGVKTLPFILFPKQEEFLRWLVEREQAQEEGVAEKSRDVGFTWLCAAKAVHGWLFQAEYAVGFGSRKLELVDTIGDPDCIFEKIRFLLNNLPGFMMPSQWQDNECKILNLDTGASITGEGGDNIGRGGRKSIYFVDEAAYLERSKKIVAALSETSNVKIWVSTANGVGNAFYEMRHSGNFPVFTFRWKEDGRKNGYKILDATGQQIGGGNGEPDFVPEGAKVVYPWYEERKKRLDPVTLAQEIDIDYTASIEGICIPGNWVRAAVEADKKLDLPRSGPVVAALDVAGEGGDSNVLGNRQGVVTLDNILDWSGRSTTYTAVKAREECFGKVEYLNFDNGGGYGEPMAQAGKEMWAQYEEAKAKAKTPEEKAAIPVPFKVYALNGGESPSNRLWPDGRTSKDKFVNARAEWWWMLRDRFRKTYERIEEGVDHPLDELISIPNNATLIAQLSTPLVEEAETGKIRIESKKNMKKRGVKSPDHGDMLAYLYAPAPGKRVLSSMGG